MIKKNMPLIVITSLITVLPVILMKTSMPLIILAVHLFGIFVTSKDKGSQGQSQKVFRLMFWFCPIISVYTAGISYLITEGIYSGIEEVSIGLFGFLFLVIGNYLPKCKMNATIGIKIPWTYSSEENWNRTHRFGGKVWVACGFLIMSTIFMPGKISTIVMVAAFLGMILVPTIYSYCFYKKEMREGKAGPETIKEKIFYNKKVGKASILFLMVIFALVGVLMFVGNIEYTFEEEALLIEADFWSDMTINYDEIESVEYLESDVAGSRIGGYGSARLLMGTFRNDDYDYYTRYSYVKCDEGILLNLGESVVVISSIDEDSTKELYEEIISKIE